MNDEIKETLEYKIDFLTKSLNIGIATKNRRYFNDIKDYITNLQQENKTLHENNQAMQEEMARVWEENEDIKCIKSLKEQLESVINENQRLLKQWFEDNDKTVKLVSEKECYKSNYNDYKSRCEKAVEYLKSYNTDFEHCRFNEAPISLRELGDLLNILQNGSDDNE